MFLGSTDPALGDEGRKQAADLASTLPALLDGEQLVSLWSSTLVRAQQTAEPIAQALDMPVQTTAAMCELDFGEWERQRLAELKADNPALITGWFQDPVTQRPPGGENFQDVRARILPWLQQLSPTGTHVVVAHYGSLAVLASLLLDMPLQRADRLRLSRGQAGRIERGSLRWWGMPTTVHTPNLGRIHR